MLQPLQREIRGHGVETAISVHKLRKEFRSRGKTIVAVDGIDFTMRRGEILGFLGPNGAGKTTTIKMLCGLVKPTSGSLLIGGLDLAVNHRKAMHRLGAVLEGSRNTYWRLTVSENLEYFAYSRGRVSSDFRQRRDRVLASLGLTEKRNEPVQKLSRGMQQKVALGCALIADPEVLLLDEPTLGLDLQSSLAIQQEIKRLADQEGKSILLTTHQMEIAHALSTRVAVMNSGRIIALDKVANLLDVFSLGAYKIRVEGIIPMGERTWLEAQWGAQLNQDESGATLRVALKEACQLYLVIEILQRCKLPISNIQRAEPNLGEIYLKLIEEESVDAARTSA